MNPLVAELIRQGLRWLGVWLMTTGIVPAEVAALVDDPETVALVTGILSYALAEGWWVLSKAKPEAAK